MFTLDRCPSTLATGFSTYSPTALRLLFDKKRISHTLSFTSPSSYSHDAQHAINNAGRLSLSGAQTKFGLIISDNTLQYSPLGQQSTYILKPRPTGYHIINQDYCAANENLTMQLASQIYGIETAPNALCFFADGQAAYITRRFDVRVDGGKYAQEDFATLLGFSRANGGSDFKYLHGSYEECAEVIKKYVETWAIDVLKYFRLLLFNFITLNDDAHLKNFSLLSNGTEYHLSPAYDLVNTSIQLYEPRIFGLEKGLFKEGMHLSDTSQISWKDFFELGKRIGLPPKLITKEIDYFSEPNNKADALIRRSFLSPELQHIYSAGYHYRQSMIRR